LSSQDGGSDGGKQSEQQKSANGFLLS
jgi:hypothetical protein